MAALVELPDEIWYDVGFKAIRGVVEYGFLFQGVLRLVCKRWSRLFSFRPCGPTFTCLFIGAARAPPPIRRLFDVEQWITQIVPQPTPPTLPTLRFHRARMNFINIMFWKDVLNDDVEAADYDSMYASCCSVPFYLRIADDRSGDMRDELARDLMIKLMRYSREGVPIVELRRSFFMHNGDETESPNRKIVYIFTDTYASRDGLITLMAGYPRAASKSIFDAFAGGPDGTLGDWFLCEPEDGYGFWFDHPRETHVVTDELRWSPRYQNQIEYLKYAGYRFVPLDDPSESDEEEEYTFDDTSEDDDSDSYE